MNTLSDRIELIELMGRYADIADLKQFTELPGRVYTDSVTLDFSAVAGIPATTMALDEYVEVLRAGFERFAATHHVITGHVVDVDGDSATIHAHVQAEHWLPDAAAGDGPRRWLVVGCYDNRAVRTAAGWRLSEVKLTPTYQENAELSGAAVAAGRAGPDA